MEADPVVEMARQTIADPCEGDDRWTEAHVQSLAEWIVKHAPVVAAAREQAAASEKHPHAKVTGPTEWFEACWATQEAVRVAAASRAAEGRE